MESSFSALGLPTEKEVRAALAKLVVRGPDAVWLPEAQTLLRLPAVRQKLAEVGEDRASDALKAVLREAVGDLGQSQYGPLLTIVLGLDPEYERLSAGEKRTIAGQEFRGGARAVSQGTIRQHHEPRALDELASMLISPPSGRAATKAAPAAPMLVWHPEVHRRWGEERLIYWRLSFLRSRPEEVLPGIEAAMRQSGVRSWEAYRLYGLFDVLLRAWIPAVEPERQIEGALLDTMKGRADLIESFTVEQILVDTTWIHDLGHTLSLSEDVLAHPLTADEINRINDGGAEIDLVPYLERGLIACPSPQAGVRFFVTLVQQGHAPIPARTRHLMGDLIADAARASPSLSDLKIYSGTGFASFLVEGVLRTPDLSALNSELLEPLAAAAFEILRTTTTFASTPKPIVRVEALPVVAGQTEDRGVENLLQQEEGPAFEVKGSAFTNLRELEEVAYAGDLLKRSSMADSLLKAVTAFLNSDGGTILVGAVEAETIHRRHALADRPFFASAPELGRYLVTGVNHEMPGGFDEFQRRLLDLCETFIQPSPTPFLSFRLDQLGGRMVCIIDVSSQREVGREWFYFGHKKEALAFYVRQGAASVALSGPAMDQYKAARSTGR